MARAVAVLVVGALAVVLAAAAQGGGAASHKRTAGEAIALRARYHRGPWKTKISLKLVKLRLIDISLCAVWNPGSSEGFTCQAVAPGQLPDQQVMRLEQNPIGRALRRADSPGWGLVGESTTGSVGAVVSNLMSGNRTGTVHYRVTLRDRSGQIVGKSNTFSLVWHR